LGARARLETEARTALNAVRRLRDAYYGKDLAHWKRLLKEGRVTQGQWTYGIPEVWTYMYGTEKLHVGAYSSLGSTFLLGGKHAIDRVTTYPHRIWYHLPGAGEDGFPTPTGDTYVGSDCWMCPGALIMSGVRIGDGAVVGGGAVVTKDVPPFAIVGGNPAKVIRYRFDEAQIEALLDIKWWDWPDDEVRAAIPLIAGDDIDAFIDYAYERLGRTRPTSSTAAGG
jgi:acetyltransferase-like isoleucine patch superfamily enzyme